MVDGLGEVSWKGGRRGGRHAALSSCSRCLAPRSHLAWVQEMPAGSCWPRSWEDAGPGRARPCVAFTPRLAQRFCSVGPSLFGCARQDLMRMLSVL